MVPSTSARRTPAARLRTAALLCQLLREEPQYRARWAPHTRQRGRGVHQGAVAHVLAEHLWAVGAEPVTNLALPRQLKDIVSRALSGRTLAPRVLTLFVDAFGMDDETGEQLHDLLSGQGARTGSRSSAEIGGLPAMGVRRA